MEEAPESYKVIWLWPASTVMCAYVVLLKNCVAFTQLIGLHSYVCYLLRGSVSCIIYNCTVFVNMNER